MASASAPAQRSRTSDGVHHETLSQNKAEELLKKIVTFNLVSTETETATMNTLIYRHTNTYFTKTKKKKKREIPKA